MKIRFNELNANMADSSPEYYDGLFGMLRTYSNTAGSVLEADEEWSLIQEEEGVSDWDVVYPKIYAAQVAHVVDRVEYIAIYSLVRDSEGEGIEVLVDQNSSFTHRIRHIPSGAKQALAEAKIKLWGRYANRLPGLDPE
jgi:catechol-2,3-dioxygenase